MILQRRRQYPPPSPALMKGIGDRLKGATALEKAYQSPLLRYKVCQGVHVHSTLAFTRERVLLGQLAQHVWESDADDIGKSKRRKQLP